MLNHQLLLLVVSTAIPHGNWGYNYSFCEFGACGHTYMCEKKESFVVAASSSAAMVVSQARGGVRKLGRSTSTRVGYESMTRSLSEERRGVSLAL